MRRSEQLDKWRRGLKSTFPIIGPIRRRRAVSAMVASRTNEDVIPLLIEALASSDPQVASQAGSALADLANPSAVDALCAAWAKARDERLGAMIAQRSYVASKPLEVRILSAMKSGKRIAIERADIVQFIVRLLADGDVMLRTAAVQALETISPGPAQDALCDEAIRNPQSAAAELCVRTGKRPSDHERLCLFLFVTRQLDAYFNEDFEFQNLRLEYDRADAQVRSHVMEVIRSGDRRCAGFLGTRSKPLAECNEDEIRLALDSWQKHTEWSRLFLACLELPLRYSLPCFSVLRKAQWEPDAPDLRSVFRQTLADNADGQASPPPPPRNPNVTSSLFEKWLAEGRSGELCQLDEAALGAQLTEAPPPRGVVIVGALSAKGRLGDGTIRQVQQSPHWLVRLAGHATGLYPPELTLDPIADPNYWITELAETKGVLEFWPAKATPADLEQLSAAPPEAFAGRLGAARKVLRTIMAHRITSGIFEPMVVEADEFAAEFVAADERDINARQQP